MTDRARYCIAHTIKRSIHWFWIVAGLLALTGLTACSPAESLTEQSVPTATPVVLNPPGHSAGKEDAQVNPTIPIPLDPALEMITERIKTELAQQLGIEVSQIALLEAESVEWRDSSLGCPQPDRMYAQVITPGYLITVQVGEKTYKYHTDQNQAIVLCNQEDSGADPAKEDPMTGTPAIPMPKDPYLQKMVALAQADLASRLALQADQIELLALEEVTWSDTSMGCPQPGMRYRQVPQDGLLIRLRAGGRVYEYHSGANRDPFLCEQTDGTPKRKRPAPIDLVPPPEGESN